MRDKNSFIYLLIKVLKKNLRTYFCIKNEIQFDQAFQTEAMLRLKLSNFFQKSTVHGFKYIAHNKVHRSERLKLHLLILENSITIYFFRIFWSLALILSFSTTLFSIRSLLLSISKTPTIIITDDNAISVTDVYFPSVTVCATTIILFEKGHHDFDFENVEKKFKLHNFTFDQLSGKE